MSMLEISVATGEAGPVMALSGEADLTSAAALSEALAAQVSGGARHLTVDVSGLRFADSASVRALVLHRPDPAGAGRIPGAGAPAAGRGQGADLAGRGPDDHGPGRDRPRTRTGGRVTGGRAAAGPLSGRLITGTRSAGARSSAKEEAA